MHPGREIALKINEEIPDFFLEEEHICALFHTNTAWIKLRDAGSPVHTEMKQVIFH